MISNCQKYLAILLTFICMIILYPQSTYATEAISQREIIRVWASLRWTDTICRVKPENEAAMDMIPYVLWHATGMFGLNTSATTRAGVICKRSLLPYDILFFRILHFSLLKFSFQLHDYTRSRGNSNSSDIPKMRGGDWR